MVERVTDSDAYFVFPLVYQVGHIKGKGKISAAVLSRVFAVKSNTCKAVNRAEMQQSACAVSAKIKAALVYQRLALHRHSADTGGIRLRRKRNKYLTKRLCFSILFERKLPPAVKVFKACAFKLRARIIIVRNVTGFIRSFKMPCAAAAKAGDKRHKGYQKQQREQSRRKYVRTRNKGACAVAAGYCFGSGKDRAPDSRTYNARNQHLREDTHTLKPPCLSGGHSFSQLRPEHRHAGKIAAHHQQRPGKHRQCRTAEIKHDVSCGKNRHRYRRGK